MALRIGLLLLGFLPFLSPSLAGARTEPAQGFQVTAALHGLRVTLIVPKRGFTLNALVQMQVRVRNTSRHPVTMLQQSCVAPNPQVQILAPPHELLYPPAVPPLTPTVSCVRPPPLTINAGQTIERRVYVVVRDRIIRASGTFTIPSSGGSRTITITTGSVRVRLLSGPAPEVNLNTSPRVSADLHPPSPPRGPLLVVSVAECPVPGGTTFVQTVLFHAVSGNRIDPGCDHPLQWRAVVGWVGQPVATITYVSE